PIEAERFTQPATTATSTRSDPGRNDFLSQFAMRNFEFTQSFSPDAIACATPNSDAPNTFRVEGNISPSSIAIGDLNGDGKPDVVTADLSNNTISLFLGNG